ncbi:hypothetical protein [Ideonella sp.]|uniref:hypothetical protein n=1 Tax=Ideonella sp. TaxID=1929293 RepID=UPI0035B2DA50
MKTHTALTLLLTLASGVAGAAEADLVSIVWGADGRFAHEAMVPPSKFVEICGQLPAGTNVDWAFDAAGPLNFNIHFHEGKQVRYPAKQDQVAKADGTLRAEIEQDYCWMWTNKAARAATLKLTLKRTEMR